MYLVSTGAEVVVHTPAKLNLFLEVRGRRPDGYHDIETCMVAVSQFDALRCRVSVDTCRIDCRWSTGMDASGNSKLSRPGSGHPYGLLPTDSRNLALRAVERLRQVAGVSQGIELELLKRIPAEAGLGGASSDAAAALIGANRIWKLGWSSEQLRTVAAELGSDIPFFLGNHQRSFGAVCSGRGEIIRPFQAAVKLHFVVIKPSVGLATPDVYRNCVPATAPHRVDSLLQALRAGHLSEIGKRLFNRLAEPAARLSPQVARLSGLLQKLPGLGCLMSGSGSSFFVLCRHRPQARRLASELRSIAAGAVFCVETVPLEFTL